MTKQSYPSLFALTIGFIPISSERLLCNFNCEPLTSEKLPQAISAIQGQFLKLLKQYDEETLFLQTAFLKFI